MPTELETKVLASFENIKSQVSKAAEKGDKEALEIKSAFNALDGQFKTMQSEVNELQQKGQQAPTEQALSFGATAVKGMDLTTKSTSFTIEGKSALLSVTHDSITGTGVVAAHRSAGVVAIANEQLTILDLITVIPSTSNSIEYIQEVGTVINAAAVAEGDALPETVFDFELKQIHIATVGHHTSVSKQVRSDAPALVALIDTRMLFGVRQKLNSELILGDGSMPNIGGLAGVTANHTAYSPAAGDDVFESLRKMIAAVEDGDFFATAILMNPADAAEMDLMKDSNGNFIAADPRTGLNARAWGLPIIKSKAIAVGKAMVIDLVNACTLWDRGETGVEVSEENGDNFIRNLVTIKADGRFQLTVEHPKAVVYGSFKGI
ncbi:MAG TPA: phage major capsid protein [Flavobacteriales bacterium]|nr:phage major capsid protein [Methylococcaceae bacterium]HHZ97635.1 phage major capsid protein [Flavobacteriales bacterium]